MFSFVFLLNELLQLTELIVNKGVGITEVLSLTAYIIPSFLVLVIPSTVLLTALLGFGRLSSDGEITAMYAGGISFYQMLIPVGVFSFVCYLLTSWLMISVLPKSNLAFKGMLYQIARSRSLVNINEREFIDDFKDMVIYVEEVDPAEGKIKGIIISDKNNLPQPYTIIAKEGSIVNESNTMRVIIKLKNGSIQNIGDDNTFRQIKFDEYQLNLDINRLVNKKKFKKREREMSIGEILAKIERKKQVNADYNPQLVELHKKFAIPFAALILGIVGAALGINTRTSSRSAGFALSIFIIFIYYILLRTGESLGELGKLPPVIGMWSPNILLGTVGGYLAYKTNNNYSIKWLNFLGEAIRQAVKEMKSQLGR